MKRNTAFILAGLACILLLVAGCTSTPGMETVATPVTTSPVATAVPTTAAAGLSWTGTWNTTWSEGAEEYTELVVLNQTGSSVTGIHGLPTELMSGTVTGNRLSGTWSGENLTGPFEFVMSADMNSFTGTWANAPDDLANSTYYWNGFRV